MTQQSSFADMTFFVTDIPGAQTWLVRFLVGFKWDVKAASEKWHNMVRATFNQPLN
jgi:hypothetical protein